MPFLKKFRHYLYDRPFLLRTDYAPLIWLKNFKKPEGLLLHCNSLLQTFEFLIAHRKGSQHLNAGRLSKKPRNRFKTEKCSQCFDGTKCSDNALKESKQNLTNSNTRSESNWVEQGSTALINASAK